MFRIQGKRFNPVFLSGASFTVASKVHPLGFYMVEFGETPNADFCISDDNGKVVDQLENAPNFFMPALEEQKTPEQAMMAVDAMTDENVNKSSVVNVIGGGTIQDVGGFACAVYKRGVPWVYVPTTLLSQADSCIGAKVGLNSGAKNLIGLFAAPTKVVINTKFLETLDDEAILSGLGEIFRLCVTGGYEYLSKFEELMAYAIARDGHALERLIRCALSVKKVVIEADETEQDLRRAMNLGHTIGHALETLSEYKIPHGIAVVLGILIEATLYGLNDDDYRRLVKAAKTIIRKEDTAAINVDGIVDVLRKDKKAKDDSVTLIAMEKIGNIKFSDMPFNEGTQEMIEKAVQKVTGDLWQLL